MEEAKTSIDCNCSHREREREREEEREDERKKERKKERKREGERDLREERSKLNVKRLS